MSRTSAAEPIAAESRRVYRVYEALARFYDAGFDWALGPARRTAVDRLPIAEGQRVLEVGVGTGLSLPHYPQGSRVTGIDISSAMLDRARERTTRGVSAEVDLRVMDAHELEFADASFDHVLAPYVISVVPEPARVMQEIRRVCRPGGRVIVVNHFGSDNALVRAGETLLSPLSQWIGFRLDLPVTTVTEASGLRTLNVERVNLFGHWRLIELERPAD